MSNNLTTDTRNSRMRQELDVSLHLKVDSVLQTNDFVRTRVWLVIQDGLSQKGSFGMKLVGVFMKNLSRNKQCLEF